MTITTLTDKQAAAGYAAGHSYAIERIDADAPTFFIPKIEQALEQPAHRAELVEFIRRVGVAILNA